MGKYKITRTCRYTEVFEVDADSEADAWEKAQGQDFAHQNDDVILEEKFELLEQQP